MKKVKRIGMIAIGMMALATTAANAQDKVEGIIQADFVNQYIWRGQNLGDISDFCPSLI